MIAICPAGPPKEMKPSLSQKRNASMNGTLRASTSLLSSARTATTTSFVTRITFTCALTSVNAQQRIQSIENHAALLKQFAVVFEQLGKPTHGRVEPCGFKPIELVVFEINVVHDLGDLAQSVVVTETEAFD